MKAVIFDFDGTIIDTETQWYYLFKEVLYEAYGFQLPLEEFAKVIGTTDEVLYKYIHSQVDKPVNREAIEEEVNTRFQRKTDVLELREGIEDLILEAKSLQLKLGIATSSSRAWVQKFLEQFEIIDQFSVIKTKEDVEKVKPDPALYVKTVEEMGIHAKEAIAIEDSVNGTLAAINAGLTCVVVPNEVTNKLIFHEKAKLYQSFSEFSLEQLINRVGKES